MTYYQKGLHRYLPTPKSWRRIGRAAVIGFLASWGVGNGIVLAGDLTSINHQADSGSAVTIRLSTSDDPEHTVFSTDSPPRIVLDMMDTESQVGSAPVSVGIGTVQQYSAISAGGRTRLVVDLTAPTAYSTHVQGNDIVLSIENSGSAGSVAAAASAGTAPPATDTYVVDEVDFRRGENGQGRVIISMNSPGASVAVNERGNHLLVDIFDADIPDSRRRRLDVVDFATPVRFIDADTRGSGVRLDLAVNGDFEHLAYQSGNDIVVEISERSAAAEAEEEQPIVSFFEDKEYSGNRVTFNFQDIEVRSVLQLIADVSDLNIVVADTVDGNITLRLTNVPWDQALDIVLDAKNLDQRRNGNVIWIAPVEEIAAREQQLLQAALERRVLEPLQTAMISLSYAKAADVKTLIEDSLQGAAGTSELGLLSERGSVTIDDRTNTLLINDTAEKIQEIRNLVAELDRPVRQVQIESRIVIARSDFNHEIGVRFGITHYHVGNTAGAFSGTGTGADQAYASIVDPQDGPSVLINPPLANRYNVNLPVANPTGSFGVSFLNSNYLLDLELSALESDGQGEVISSPRVITANQAEAFIQQGVEIPFQQSTSSGATSVEFKEAVLELRVTPLITPDNRIQMDLAVKQDTVGDVFTLANGNQIPAIDTRELATSVLVNNGETIVLGGIYQDEQNYTEDKVPGLGDLPVIGGAFRKRTTENEKRELLIFITPNILDDLELAE